MIIKRTIELSGTANRSVAAFESILLAFQANMDDALDMWVDAIAQ